MVISTIHKNQPILLQTPLLARARHRFSRRTRFHAFRSGLKINDLVVVEGKGSFQRYPRRRLRRRRNDLHLPRGPGQWRREYERGRVLGMFRPAKPISASIHKTTGNLKTHGSTPRPTAMVPHSPSSSTMVKNLPRVTFKLSSVRSLLSSQSGSLNTRLSS